MFTGIVTDVGEVVAAQALGPGRRLEIASAYDPDGIAIGASIACGGPCLTVVSVRAAAGGAAFSVDISPETIARTTLGEAVVGTRLNLERALRAGDELGGHIVSGHVDAVALLVARDEEGGTARLTFEAPAAVMPFIAEKGSIALDGTSLTVNGVAGNRFWLTLIPHTLAVTTWGERQPGDRVNLEIDMLARYVARLRESAAG